MPAIDIYNLRNEVVGSLDLNDSVFGAEVNDNLIYEAVRWYRAGLRSGSAKTKRRWEVAGSGKKLWKQKGTGRARVASIRSPLWKGGGNVHGPQARDWSQPLPKKMRRGALRSALSERLREGNLVVVEELVFSQPKTKEFVSAMSALGLSGKTLVVDTVDNDNLLLASRNVKGTKVVGPYGVNIYDVLYHEKLVLTRSAAAQLQAQLDPKRANASADAEPGEENTQEEEAA